MMLETGKITEEEFDKKESELLDRLEQIEEYKKKHYGVKEEDDENAIEADASNLVQNTQPERVGSVK